MSTLSQNETLKVGSSLDIQNRLEVLGEINFFLINIDNFSNINHAYGYQIGTAILNQFAKYLNMLKPATAELFQFYSDKYVLIDTNEYTKNDLALIAEEILAFFSQTDIFVNDAIELNLSLSIGISTAQGVVNIPQAEIAIKELREGKRNHYNIFNPNSEFVKREQKEIYWITKIQNAVVNEDIVAYFQPIVNNHTGKIEKYECLARLRHDETIISPSFFMNATKSTGSLSYVTKAIISQSFKMFSSNDLAFSINITGEDLVQNYLEEYLLRNVKIYNISPSRVVLELLEDITTLDKGTTLKQLTSLREHGFKVAIDDFGAENSNMMRLLEIKPDYLKIDGAFIKNIVDDVKSQIIVEAIIGICKKSGIQIIAEYVHNAKVQERVKSLGIDYSQGYFFSEPRAKLVTL